MTYRFLWVVVTALLAFNAPLLRQLVASSCWSAWGVSGGISTLSGFGAGEAVCDMRHFLRGTLPNGRSPETIGNE
jgi:hypothetical protein